jgi:hypothetical protein
MVPGVRGNRQFEVGYGMEVARLCARDWRRDLRGRRFGSKHEQLKMNRPSRGGRRLVTDGARGRHERMDRHKLVVSTLRLWERCPGLVAANPPAVMSTNVQQTRRFRAHELRHRHIRTRCAAAWPDRAVQQSTQVPLFAENSAGRVGVIDIVTMAAGDLGANVRISAERFPDRMYDVAKTFSDSHKANIQFGE